MDGAGRWFFQRISGIALLVFLLSHFWVTHYSPGGEVTYQKVALRLVQPEWKFFNLTFLDPGPFHGLNGMWTISEDYITREWLRTDSFRSGLDGRFISLGVGDFEHFGLPAKNVKRDWEEELRRRLRFHKDRIPIRSGRGRT